MPLTVDTALSDAILARYGNFVCGVPGAAEILLLQPETEAAPAPAAVRLAQTVWNLQSFVEQNLIFNLHWNVSFLQRLLSSAASPTAETALRALRMTQRESRPPERPEMAGPDREPVFLPAPREPRRPERDNGYHSDPERIGERSPGRRSPEQPPMVEEPVGSKEQKSAAVTPPPSSGRIVIAPERAGGRLPQSVPPGKGGEPPAMARIQSLLRLADAALRAPAAGQQIFALNNHGSVLPARPNTSQAIPPRRVGAYSPIVRETPMLPGVVHSPSAPENGTVLARPQPGQRRGRDTSSPALEALQTASVQDPGPSRMSPAPMQSPGIPTRVNSVPVQRPTIVPPLRRPVRLEQPIPDSAPEVRSAFSSAPVPAPREQMHRQLFPEQSAPGNASPAQVHRQLFPEQSAPGNVSSAQLPMRPPPALPQTELRQVRAEAADTTRESGAAANIANHDIAMVQEAPGTALRRDFPASPTQPGRADRNAAPLPTPIQPSPSPAERAAEGARGETVQPPVRAGSPSERTDTEALRPAPPWYPIRQEHRMNRLFSNAVSMGSESPAAWTPGSTSPAVIPPLALRPVQTGLRSVPVGGDGTIWPASAPVSEQILRRWGSAGETPSPSLPPGFTAAPALLRASEASTEAPDIPTIRRRRSETKTSEQVVINGAVNAPLGNAFNPAGQELSQAVEEALRNMDLRKLSDRVYRELENRLRLENTRRGKW